MEGEAGAGAGELEVAYGALGVDGREAVGSALAVSWTAGGGIEVCKGLQRGRRTGNCLGIVVSSEASSGWRGLAYF